MQVAVKVQFPQLRERCEGDVSTIAFLVDAMRKVLPPAVTCGEREREGAEREGGRGERGRWLVAADVRVRATCRYFPILTFNGWSESSA
jgi:hypothetical protein